jgi:hypothetical protein
MFSTSTCDALAATAILVVGAPRSGTTWLAKVLDSHPDTVYRHEPDEVVPAGGSIEANVAIWLRQRDARTVGKRPFFPKSWQAAPARWVRSGLIYAGAAASSVGFPAWPIPDLGAIAQARVVLKSVRLSTGIGEFAGAYPEGRALLILRHPCGQVASVMRGAGEGAFDLAEAGTDMPYDEVSAIAFAARHGMAEAEFQRQPDAAKYAWSWREFNETAVASIAGRSNAHVIVYEDLCTRPTDEARAVLIFAGLPWHRQTETFLSHSTSYDGPAGFYAVVRNSRAAAERWRVDMAPQDQNAVRAVVCGSPVIRYWPDLAAIEPSGWARTTASRAALRAPAGAGIAP